MKKTFMYAAAFSLVSLAPSFANDVDALIKSRDAIEAKMKAIETQLEAEMKKRDQGVQLDQNCMKSIMDAQGNAEKVTDHACLASWLEAMKAGKAMMLEDRPVFQEMKKLGKARMNVNMKLIEALLAQKK